MSAWKQFERDVARLLGGKRFWANSGEAIDVESDSYVAQCKLVQTCSLASLTELAEMVERQAALKNKAGVVAIKLRRGRGRSSPMLLVVTAATWERLNGTAEQKNFALDPSDLPPVAELSPPIHNPRCTED